MGQAMKDLLFSFEGRIPRAPYWGGSILVGLIAFGIAFLTVFLFTEEGGSQNEDTALRVGSALGLVLLYPVSALMTKRVKDRDRPLWLVKLFLIPYGLYLVGDIIGITAQYELVGEEVLRTNTTAGEFLMFVNLAMMLWALVELGVLRGTEGDNQWGPDPLMTSHKQDT